MNNCLCCASAKLTPLWSLSGMPAFQNRVHASPGEARAIPRAQVRLVQCQGCGFVFNQAFEPGLMVYDAGYQNEQAHSGIFRDHLHEVVALLQGRVPAPAKVVEVGCGKGFFLDELARQGYAVTGFDPAYEGDNPAVRRQYFGPGAAETVADLVVLRHTLEHVPDPLGLLRLIAEGNGNSGLLYVEVPCLDWIVEKKAFWDIFHEHHSYFTAQTLTGLFGSCELRRTFGGQYLSLLADLGTLLPRPASKAVTPLAEPFSAELERWRGFALAHQGLVVWGAGAKGAAFVNAIDPENRAISAVVDINPAKQNRYVTGTGHRIVGPQETELLRGRVVLVMNENYLGEVAAMTKGLNVTLKTLGAA